jgi:hypothetical protein
LWGVFVIEGSAGDVLFMGDTAFGEFLEEIKKKFAHFRLAILPIGSYEKRWFMKNQHMNPDDAVRVHRMIEITQSAGIHSRSPGVPAVLRQNEGHCFYRKAGCHQKNSQTPGSMACEAQTTAAGPRPACKYTPFI